MDGIKYANKLRILFLLYSIDNYVYFIREFRRFEQLPQKYCALKIQMIFNQDDILSGNLIKRWNEMGNNFTRFFLNLTTLNQKEILGYFQIPVGKKTFSQSENTDSLYYEDCALLPDSLQDINHLLFYFNNRSLDQPVANIQLAHLPQDLEKKLANGSNWADYILSLPYEKQVFVLLIILQS